MVPISTSSGQPKSSPHLVSYDHLLICSDMIISSPYGIRRTWSSPHFMASVKHDQHDPLVFIKHDMTRWCSSNTTHWRLSNMTCWCSSNTTQPIGVRRTWSVGVPRKDPLAFVEHDPLVSIEHDSLASLEHDLLVSNPVASNIFELIRLQRQICLCFWIMERHFFAKPRDGTHFWMACECSVFLIQILNIVRSTCCWNFTIFGCPRKLVVNTRGWTLEAPCSWSRSWTLSDQLVKTSWYLIAPTNYIRNSQI